MTDRPTQAIMDRVYGLMETRYRSRNSRKHAREANRDPREDFNELSNRGKADGSARGRGNTTNNTTGSHTPRNPTNSYTRGTTCNMPALKSRPTMDTHASGRSGCSGLNHSKQRLAQPSDSGRRYAPESRMTDTRDQMGYTQVTTAIAIAIAFEPLNRSLEISLTRLFK